LAAKARDGLADIAKAKLWDDPDVRRLNEHFLDTLLRLADQADVAVVILTPDDVVRSRKQSMRSPRDYLIFEAGLFFGRLGLQRTFLVAPDTPEFKLPTDIASIVIAKYPVPLTDTRALTAVLPGLRNAIQNCGTIQRQVYKNRRMCPPDALPSAQLKTALPSKA